MSWRGFTLIELLVAISVFGLVSLIAFSGLQSTLQARETLAEQADRLTQLHKSFHIMREDFEQVVPRTVRDQLGSPSSDNAFISVDNGVLFTRGGRENPLGLPRSGLERLGWGIKEGKLVRARWQALDPGNEEIIEEIEYLEGLQALSFRFLDDELEWIEQWPPLNVIAEGPLLPRAVEVTLELEDVGVLHRVFVLPF